MFPAAAAGNGYNSLVCTTSPSRRKARSLIVLSPEATCNRSPSHCLPGRPSPRAAPGTQQMLGKCAHLGDPVGRRSQPLPLSPDAPRRPPPSTISLHSHQAPLPVFPHLCPQSLGVISGWMGRRGRPEAALHASSSRGRRSSVTTAHRGLCRAGLRDKLQGQPGAVERPGCGARPSRWPGLAYSGWGGRAATVI